MPIFDSARDSRFGDGQSPSVAVPPMRPVEVLAVLGVPDITTRFNADNQAAGKGELVADINQVLQLIVGSSLGFNVALQDPAGAPAQLSGATRATLLVVSDLGSSPTTILSLDTTGGLVIDIPNSRLVATLQQSQADALIFGDWVLQVAVEFGTGNWKLTKYVLVRIIPAFAPKLP